MFKKYMVTVDGVRVLGGEKEPDDFFPGFRYRMNDMVYTIIRDCSKEPTSPMKEVSLEDGTKEILTIETIIADIKDSRTVILEPDMKLVPENIKKAIEESKNAKKE